MCRIAIDRKPVDAGARILIEILMFRKLLIGFAGAIAVCLLVLYALSIWMFGRRQRPAMTSPGAGQVVSLSHARSARSS
jgi:hypothetical protein